MNALFLVSMFFGVIFGLGFILFPGTVLDPLGVTLGEAATIFARLFGSAILSFVVLLWSARKSVQAEFRLGVANSIFVFYVLIAVLLLIAQLNYQMNALGWSIIALHAVLALWYGYYLVKERGKGI